MSIENEIQAKGLTEHRITSDDIEKNIKSEWFFTALDGVFGADDVRAYRASKGYGNPLPTALQLISYCVLELKNGSAVTGVSISTHHENFDRKEAQNIARQSALNQVLSLMDYELKCRLAREAAEQEGGAA
jgi:hypothetical protein